MHSSHSFYYDNWQRLMDTVSKTESLLRKIRFSSTKDYFFWKYGFMHVIFIIVHGWQIHRWLTHNQCDLVISYIGFRYLYIFGSCYIKLTILFFFRLVHYCLTFITLIIYQWFIFLSTRYNYLEKYLKRIFSQRIIITHHVVEELHMIWEIYKNLTVISQELNTIFSIYLFFIIFLTMMLTLHGLSFAILLGSSLSTCLPAVVYVALHMVSILEHLILCDLC